jgi:hypothetical protein
VVVIIWTIKIHLCKNRSTRTDNSFMPNGDQVVLPDRSPERALPYDTDPVCEVVAAARDFWICRILKTSLGNGWLWTVAVSSSSCPTVTASIIRYRSNDEVQTRFFKLGGAKLGWTFKILTLIDIKQHPKPNCYSNIKLYNFICFNTWKGENSWKVL